MTEAQPGDRVIWKGQLGTLLQVHDELDVGRDPIAIVWLDDGKLIPAVPETLSLVDPSEPNDFHFTPHAFMQRTTDGGWRLYVDWSDSQQGASIGGVLVDDLVHIPDAQAASQALDAWLKQSPANRNGVLVFTLRDAPGGPPLVDLYGHCDTCGTDCDADGCTRDRTHPAALDVDDERCQLEEFQIEVRRTQVLRLNLQAASERDAADIANRPDVERLPEAAPGWQTTGRGTVTVSAADGTDLLQTDWCGANTPRAFDGQR